MALWSVMSKACWSSLHRRPSWRSTNLCLMRRPEVDGFGWVCRWNDCWGIKDLAFGKRQREWADARGPRSYGEWSRTRTDGSNHSPCIHVVADEVFLFVRHQLRRLD